MTHLKGRTPTHGGKGTSVYNAWLSMRDRCNRPKHPHFARYGGRGISVCERWADFATFRADIGPKPPGNRISLERRDNDGNYEPGNCYWATTAQQSVNRCNNRYLEIDGRRTTVTEAARARGLSRTCLIGRLVAGWPLDKALSTPARPKRAKADGRTSTEEGSPAPAPSE